MTDPLATLSAATEARKRSQREWEEAVREAVKTHSLRKVAPSAGVSHARIGQIVKGEK